MTDDDLLCSEADISHLKMRRFERASAQVQAVAELRRKGALGIPQAVSRDDWRLPFTFHRLAEPATDPYEIEKE